MVGGVQPEPRRISAARLTGAACPGAANCLAVGWFTDGASGDTLPTAEQWNGTSWSLLSVPDPSGSTDAQLDGVACGSTSNCFAAGFSMGHTLTEHGTARRGHRDQPQPELGEPALGVACPSASRCWAVGYTLPGTGPAR